MSPHPDHHGPQGDAGPRITVLIVDDDELARSGLRMILESEADVRVVGEAVDGKAGVALAERLRPDVVLMDLRMPNLDGIEATRRIAARDVRSRVLVITAFGEEGHREALLAGARAFLPKDMPAEELVLAVRSAVVPPG